jgi:hypothetical protein
MNRKIIVRLQGGFGNQLFQYATAFAAARRLQAELILDPTRRFVNDPYRRSFRLSNCNITARIASPQELESVGRLSVTLSRAYRKAEWILMTRFGRYHLPWLFRPRFENPIVFDGYGQSYKYFNSIGDVLTGEFSIRREALSGAAREWGEIFTSEQAVALHVRRIEYRNLCPIKYYENAVRTLTAAHPLAKFYIFADDHNWAKENLSSLIDATAIKINGELSDIEEFWLMTKCRHFIIANSSYSWWAAWLGSYGDKMVIAPRDGWCVGHEGSTDLLPPTWVRL